jgi:hypothetical protein
VGTFHGRRWGKTVAAVGDFLVAADIPARGLQRHVRLLTPLHVAPGRPMALGYSAARPRSRCAAATPFAGWWPQHDGIRLFDPGAVKIVRYGYRGDRTPTSGHQHRDSATPARHDVWRAGCGEIARPARGRHGLAQSSGELKGFRRELRDARVLWAVLTLEFVQAGGGGAVLSRVKDLADFRSLKCRDGRAGQARWTSCGRFQARASWA